MLLQATVSSSDGQRSQANATGLLRSRIMEWPRLRCAEGMTISMTVRRCEILLVERAVTFTGGQFQPPAVKDTNLAATIVDNLPVSKSVGGAGDACAARAQMTRDLLLRERQPIVSDAIMKQQQPTA